MSTPERLYTENLQGSSYRKLGFKYNISHTTVMRRINITRDGTFKSTSLLRSLLDDYPEHREWLVQNVPCDNEDKYYSISGMQNSIDNHLSFKEEIYIE